MAYDDGFRGAAESTPKGLAWDTITRRSSYDAAPRAITPGSLLAYLTDITAIFEGHRQAVHVKRDRLGNSPRDLKLRIAPRIQSGGSRDCSACALSRPRQRR